jgi:outer membrane protein OmpA-like peptidoglycan-associated protein
MMDEQDQGTRIGVGVALGVALLVAIGLSLWLSMRGTQKAPAASTIAAVAEAFIDAPLAGEVAGTLYFAVGQAELPPDASMAVDKVKQALAAAPAKKLVLSGFHDPTGDPATNAELAKNRAKAVRAALQAGGVDAARIALRKPESTTGSGSDQEARRVEIRLVE